MGVVTVPLLGGIFPVLMLAASRKKGEYVPETVFKWLGHPLVIISIYLLFSLSILLHGVVIWEQPVLRMVALLVTGIAFGMTYIVMQGGAFAKVGIIEIRVDHNLDGLALLSAVAAGQPLQVEMELDYGNEKQTLHAASVELARFNQLKKLKIELPQIPMRDLKLWAHQITTEDNSISIPTFVVVHSGENIEQFNLKDIGGQAVVQLQDNTPHQITIHLADSD